VVTSSRTRKWRSSVARDFRDMTSSASVEDAVVRVASELLDQVRCPPTDLETICEKLHVKTRDSHELIGSGALIKQGESLQILCAPDLSQERRRFTIAHELGHVVLARRGEKPVRQSRELERLCDMFAAELLMPTATFIQAVGRVVHVQDIPALARSFQVSLTSAAIRCAELRRVSIFEADEDRILWGSGIIRRGRTRDIDQTLFPAIAKAIAGAQGTDQVYMNIDDSIRKCEVEYWPFGRSRRALILIRVLSVTSNVPI
jgi:Zn-dependent peptidase ImmA (M78 family)